MIGLPPSIFWTLDVPLATASATRRYRHRRLSFIRFGIASSQIGRFASVPPAEYDAAAFTAVCGGLDYGDFPATFVPLQEALLLLRPKGAFPRPLTELAPAGMKFSCGEDNSCVLLAEQAMRNLQDSELAAAFLYPGLKRSKKLYHRVLMRLRESGMIDVVPSGEAGAVIERVGIFAVPKKDGRQRLVVDCRRANCWFADHPKAHLPTCAAYSRLSMPPGSTFYSGGFDLKDAFFFVSLSCRCISDHIFALMIALLAFAPGLPVLDTLLSLHVSPLYLWVGLMLSMFANAYKQYCDC